MKPILFLGVCFLLTPNLFPAFPYSGALAQDPKELIRMIDQQQKKIQTMTGSFVQRKETALSKDPLVSSGTVQFKRPDRIHWIYQQPHPLEVSLNGRKMRIYDPRRNQLDEYFLAPGKRITQAMEPMLQVFQRTFAELGEKYALFYEGAEGDRRVRFRLEPKEERMRKVFSRLELWIDKATGAILRFEMTEANEDRLCLEFKNLQMNPPLTENDLEIKVSPSTKVTESAGP